jgi:hypothetical protein
MSLDNKLPKNDSENLKSIAANTDNPQMKIAIESRLKNMSKDNTVSK